ncbi:hypothetical protein LCGC14_2301290 [marine sediment metagenome]|uniref:Uncharacterized protein n=1 Tax=marine sediment metagenome TaxID=412755 RepID=A0A0F9CNX5_9ZZZZ
MKNRYTGFSDKFEKRLWENDEVLYYVSFLKSWVKGQIIFRDDIPRISHRYAIEILNLEIAKNVKKMNKKYKGISMRKGK